MKFERDDAKVGLLVLIALTLFASLAFHRTIRFLLNREVLHQVVLRNVSDLSVGTEVQLQGLRVGQTNAVEMRREGTAYHFVATVGIRPDVVLWRGTKGIVNSRLVGGSYLELRLPPVEERRVELRPGEPMDGETASSINSLVASLEELTRNLNQSVSELRGELKGRGLESVIGHPDVRGTLREAISAFAAFRAAARVTERTISHGDGTLSMLERNMVSLEKSLGVVQGLLERRGTDIDELIVQLGTTLAVPAAGSGSRRAPQECRSRRGRGTPGARPDPLVDGGADRAPEGEAESRRLRDAIRQGTRGGPEESRGGAPVGRAHRAPEMTGWTGLPAGMGPEV